MTTVDPRITAAFFAAPPEADPEAGLGHDYEGRELQSGTPEYEALYAKYRAWAKPEPEASESEPGYSLGVYGGQPVMEGHHAELVYDCEPHTRDGCLIPVPADFLGMPRWPEPELGPEFEAEAEL